MCLALCVGLALAAESAGAIPATIIAGPNRYDTSVELSRASHPGGAPAVIVASGVSWPDALGASALAGAADAPILLSGPKGMSPEVEAEIRRLGPARAFIIGGTAAVPSRVEMQLARSMPSGTAVERIGGRDRYVVSRRLAERVVQERGVVPERTFVVTGRDFPDGLSCAAPAAAGEYPVLLADPAHPERVSDAVAALGVPNAVIVGGVAAVPASVESKLRAELGWSHAARLSGYDRYAVAIRVAQFAEKVVGLSLERPLFASGVVYADALSAGPLAARSGFSVLLVRDAEVPDSVAEALFAWRQGMERFTFVGGDVVIPPIVRAEAAFALRARPFSANRAMEHVKALAGLGPRGAGGAAERRAADYIAARLDDYGYAVARQAVYLPGGKRSQNVVATLPGSSPGVIVLGAHFDSKPPSPGANDNASGVAVVLELARCLADADLAPTVRFIGFGAEEIGGPTPSDHHFGSRQYVESLSSAQLSAIEGMVSVDMVGYGSVFNIRNLRVAPMTTIRSLQSWGTRSGEPLAYLKDFGRSGWSDHEAFEFSGVPVAWLEWRDDPHYHTTRDTYSHVSRDRVRRSGRVVRGWLVDMTAADLRALR